MQKFKYGVLMKPLETKIMEGELPELEKDEVLVKMKACNICTTDYGQFAGLRDHQGFPYAGGHEWAGEIAAKGEDVVDEYQVGDLVAALIGVPCGQCEACLSGNVSECRHNVHHPLGEDKIYGYRRFADYTIVKARTLIPMKKEVSPEIAAFVEPLSSCVGCAKRAGIKPLEDVVIVGAGTMGILNALTARVYGARVIITELSKKKLERANSLGFADVVDSSACDPIQAVKALTNGKGADIVIMCVGNSKAYAQGYAMMRENRGKFILFPAGYPKPEMEFDPNEVHYRQISIIGSFGSTIQDFHDAGELINKGLVDPGYALEQKSFPLSRFQEAMEAAAAPDAYRVTVELDKF